MLESSAQHGPELALEYEDLQAADVHSPAFAPAPLSRLLMSDLQPDAAYGSSDRGSILRAKLAADVSSLSSSTLAAMLWQEQQARSRAEGRIMVSRHSKLPPLPIRELMTDGCSQQQ